MTANLASGLGLLRKFASTENKGRHNFYVGTGFEAMSLEATTDHQGKYTIAGVPCEMKVSRSVVLSSTSEKSSNLGIVWLEENESRPMMVSHIGDTNLIETTLATRFEKKLRDSRLLGFPVMVILSDKSDAVADFVNVNFVNYDLRPEVASYLQFAIPRNKTSQKETDADFLKEHNWQLPIAGSIFACVLNANGDEVGKMEVDVSEKGADEEVAAFVSKYLPPKLDAEKKWMKAFAEAKRTNRKVLARLGGRYCGPCFLLRRATMKS